MPQSRENVRILCMLEGLPQQVRPTSYSGGLCGGPTDFLHPMPDSGTGPHHHIAAGCYRQGSNRGEWVAVQKVR
eukprot:3348094-Ditylum_brightwellii.AAC.1